MKISKSKFKPRSLEFFRHVQETGEELVITDHGTPVLKIIPYTNDANEEHLQVLRGSIISFDNPLDPVGEEGWELA